MRTIRSADGQVVCDEQEGQPALLVEVPHQVDDLAALAVEVAGRVVGPDDCRVADQRPRDRDPLALAARELVGEVVGAASKVDEATPRKARSRASAASAHQERQLDVLDRA